jgi:hypothetical protein
METLLHTAWKHKLYISGNFTTKEGMLLEIIDPGISNSDAGPDFFNAKIKLNGQLWVGNIEIHIHSSDWYKHKHEKDKAYNSVILHVVEWIDREEIRDESGRSIPQWVIPIPDAIKENYFFLLNNNDSIPCLSRIKEINTIYLSDWKNALLTERLERKTNTIFQLLDTYRDDWTEVLYICLSRNFGFGINNDAFERLAKSLPLKYILKHQDSQKQVEALFLGQAGLLEEADIEDEYFRTLQQEYRFLQKKYHLQALEGHLFKNLRIRPNNFPHVKIVQLAGFIRRGQHLVTQILKSTQLSDFHALFSADVSEYWKSHYQFGKSSCEKSKRLGKSAVSIILINTVVPFLFAYGKKRNMEIFKERSLQLIAAIPAESNFITTLFSRAGIEVSQAGDSQALIQLKREYCEKKKCIFCRIGYKLLAFSTHIPSPKGRV